MIKAVYCLSYICLISLLTLLLHQSLPESSDYSRHLLPFHDFSNPRNNRHSDSHVHIQRLHQKELESLKFYQQMKREPWLSYINGTDISQQANKSSAYDSSNVWVEPTCFDYDHLVPKRPTALFNKVTLAVCQKVPKACRLFNKTFTDTWDNSVEWLKDGSVYLITGDIPLMWLRDSTAQVTPYLQLADEPAIQQLLEGLLKRQMKWIEHDPYGSAFRMFLDFDHAGKNTLTNWDFKCGRTIHVAQHDYEMDSLSYVVRLAYLYWKKTARTCWMDNQLQRTLHTVVDLWIHEQDHNRSTYRYPTLSNSGKGSKVCYTGMSWSGMRPSDDSMKYHYNIPENLFATTVLGYIQEMSYLWADKPLRLKAEKLQREIMDGVYKYGVKNGVLAYEVDGCGNYLFADDANIPSLLSLPYLGVNISPELYSKTRRFILSERNPWYYKGKTLSGIGSPHTPGEGRVWHLALIMESLTGGDTLDMVLNTARDGLHESVTERGSFTRRWFGWANSLFAEWMMKM